MRYLFFFLLLLAVDGMAQQEGRNDGWVLRANASALIDLITFPTLQFSVERKLGEQFSISAEYGFQPYTKFHNQDTAWGQETGSKYALEGRFYLHSSFSLAKGFFSGKDIQAPEGWYLGLQFFHTNNHYTASQTYYPVSDTTFISSLEDYFSVDQQKTGGRIILGIQAKVAPRCYLDLYGGLGLKYKRIENGHREYDPGLHNAEDCIDLCYDYYDLRESSGTKGSFSCGLRLGFSF